LLSAGIVPANTHIATQLAVTPAVRHRT
jgi:hypothetical protein